jgi:hypothetical protein
MLPRSSEVRLRCCHLRQAKSCAGIQFWLYPYDHLAEMLSATEAFIGANRVLEIKHAIDNRHYELFCNISIHRDEMLRRSDGDAKDIRIHPLQAGEIRLRPEPSQDPDLGYLSARGDSS